MGETGVFRVKVMLSSYFDDHRAKAYVIIDKQWANVRQVHKHIKDIFGIHKFYLTTDEDIYLPGWFSTASLYGESLISLLFPLSASEDINIIHIGDVLV